MKKLLFVALLISQTVAMQAQNTWEMTEEERQELAQQRQKKQKKVEVSTIDAKYAPGAVPIVNGSVEFEKTINAPSKTKNEIQAIIKGALQEWVDEPNQIINEAGVKLSQVNYDNPEEGLVAARFYEYLVFKRAALSLDETDFDFQIIAVCSDGKAVVKMNRIRYTYEIGRPGGFSSPAEEIIIDEYALNKKQTKLSRVYGKFRKKTIDRKEYIFNELEKRLTK